MNNHAAKGKLFDNCLIVAPDGEPLGRCSEKRINWYLNRGIATLVQHQNPKTIQLLFEPQGRAGNQMPTVLFGKPNLCVVCGATENLNRHHVIPHNIIKHMPEKFKCHNSYDIVGMCLDCHEEYEKHSQLKREKIGEEMKISPHGYCWQTDPHIKNQLKCRSIAQVLLYKNIPVTRQEEMLTKLREITNKEPTLDFLKELVNSNPLNQIDTRTFGEIYIEKVTDMNQMVREWRQHFLDTMKPKYMLKEWNVDQKLPSI